MNSDACGGYKGQHFHPQLAMLAQLPPEIIDQIIECLPSKGDALSIALVCSPLRSHANRRLFRSLRVFVERGNIVPVHAEMILFYPHLLQYPTHLMILPPGRPPKSVHSQEHGEIPTIPVHYLWNQLVNMPRLTSLGLHVSSGDYGALLSALEGLDTARNITFYLGDRIQSDISISENSFPVKRLTLGMNERSHRLEKQLLQKCSQSLFELRLILYDAHTPDFPFLPFLRILSLVVFGKRYDITPWLPFLMKHPSLTSVMLTPAILSVNPVHPSLLPNLQSLKAHPFVIEQLIPGRPVHTVTIYHSDDRTSSYNSIFRSLALPCVPVTTLYIDAAVYAIQSTQTLVDMIRSLPMLRALDLLIGYQFPFALEDVLRAFGKCRYINRIRSKFSDFSQGPPDKTRSIQSRDDIADMIATIQESGANDLWSFQIEAVTSELHERGTAERIGWLSVASQPNLKGEWKISLT